MYDHLVKKGMEGFFFSPKAISQYQQHVFTHRLHVPWLPWQRYVTPISRARQSKLTVTQSKDERVHCFGSKLKALYFEPH